MKVCVIREKTDSSEDAIFDKMINKISEALSFQEHGHKRLRNGLAFLV